MLVANLEQATASSHLRELTTKLAAGDDAAWSQFHREYGPLIFRQLLAATRGDHHLADEALQQTYLRVARHVRPCDAEPMFGAWLRVVARTVLSDRRRRRRNFWQLLVRRRAEPEIDGDNAADEERLQRALDVALAALDPADRALLEGKYLAGRDVRTLATELGITPKATESRLTRARAQLRQLLLAGLAHE